MMNCYTIGISLPRFDERWQHLLSELNSKIVDNFEIVGVDGYANFIKSENESADPLSSFSPGQIGCALSHLLAYRRMQKLGVRHAFIIEDDVILPWNIEQIVDEVLPHLPHKGVISLFSPRPSPTRYTAKNAPETTFGRLIAPVETLDTHSSVAYLISIDAAGAILEYNNPVKNLADHWFAFHAAGAVNRVLLLFPMPCRVTHFESSIGYDSSDRIGKLKKLIKNFRVSQRLLRIRRARLLARQMNNIVLVDEPSFYER